MKQISNEFKKIYGNRNIWICILLLFFLNLGTSYYIYNDIQPGKISYSHITYRNAYRTLLEGSGKEALQYVQNALENVDMWSEEGREEYRMWSDIYEELGQSVNYADYIDGKLEEINDLKDLNLTALASPYNYKNLQQTEQDLNQLKNHAIGYGPSKGWQFFFQSITADFYSLIFILYVIMQLILKERQTGQLALYKVTYYGHRTFAFTKWAVLMGSVLGIMLLLQSTNLYLANGMYGLGDWSREIQSIIGYGQCRFEVSISFFLLLFLIVKFLTYCSIASLFAYLTVRTRSTVDLYAMIIAILGIGAICYYAIPLNSRLSILKYLNPYALLMTGNMMGQYRNVNFLGLPYSYSVTGIFVIIIILFLSVYLFIDAFDHHEYQLRTGRSFLPFDISKLSCYRLFWHEIMKVLYDGRCAIIFILFILYVVVSIKPVDQMFYIPKDYYYDVYVEYLEGPVTDEKIRFINEKTAELEQNLLEEDTDDSVKNSYNALNRIQMILTPYLQEVQGYYLINDGYRLLTGDNEVANYKDVKLAIVSVIVLMYPLSTLFCMDYQCGIMPMIESCVYGREKRRRTQIGIGIIMVTATYLFAYAPFYISVIQEYGLPMPDAPACSMQHLEVIPHHITIGWYLIAVIILRYIGLLSVMFLCYGLSRKIGNVMELCLILLGVVVLPLVFVYINIPGTQYWLLNPLLLGNCCSI